MLSSIVQMCSSGFTKLEQEEMMRGWFAKRSTKGFDRAVEQSCDSVRAKAGWISRDGGDVEGWLKKEGYLGGEKRSFEGFGWFDGKMVEW